MIHVKYASLTLWGWLKCVPTAEGAATVRTSQLRASSRDTGVECKSTRFLGMLLSSQGSEDMTSGNMKI